MQGRRVSGYFDAQPGDYWTYDFKTWFAFTPTGLHANLAGHHVVLNSDDTITVSPSILVTDGETGIQWHGFLEKGIWREC